MGIGTYILDANGEPVPEPRTLAWGAWLEEHRKERIIAQTDLGDGIVVSTIFIGLDHNFSANGPPILFETAVLQGRYVRETLRYATRAEAVKGHEAMVAWARQNCEVER